MVGMLQVQSGKIVRAIKRGPFVGVIRSDIARCWLWVEEPRYDVFQRSDGEKFD